MLQALWDDLDALTAERPVDVVCFSGDLVLRGDHTDSFAHVFENFVYPLLNHSKSQFFCLVPGNHDVDRTAVSVVEDDFISHLATSEQVDEYLATLQESVRLANFYTLADEVAPAVSPIGLGRAYVFDVQGIKVGVAALNSAWASCRDNERSKILVGKCQVESLLEHLTDCDVKIAMMHHPLDWLLESEQQFLEHRFRDVDMVLTGHRHESEDHLLVRRDEQTIYNTAGAIFSPGEPDHNAYAVLTLDIDESPVGAKQVTVRMRTYDSRVGRYVDDESWNTAGTALYILGNVDSSYFEMQNRIYNAYDKEADEGLLAFVLDQELRPIREIFVEPVLKRVSEYVKEQPDSDNAPVELQTIIDSSSHVCFVGKTHMGKSTLMRYVGSQARAHGAVPLYVDLDELNDTDTNIMRLIASHVDSGATRQDIETLFVQGKVWLLVDNMTTSRRERVHALRRMVERHESNRLILSIRENLWESIEVTHINNFLGIELESYYLQSPDRKKVRQYVEHLARMSDSEAVRPMLDKLMTIFARTSLPRSPFNITLLIYLLLRETNVDPINESSLMRYFMELVLERVSRRELRLGTYTFDDKERFLAYIAEAVYRTPDKELTENQFRRLVNVYHDDLKWRESDTGFQDLFFAKGILLNKGGGISFRFRGVYEYYLAKMALRNASLYSELVGMERILNLTNVISHLSGITGDRVDLVHYLHKALYGQVAALISTIDDLRLALFEGVDLGGLKMNLTETLENMALSESDLDELSDYPDRNTDYESQRVSIDSEELDDFGRFVSLFVLFGRVVRNTHELRGDDKQRSVELFLLTGVVLWYMFASGVDTVLAGALPPDWHIDTAHEAEAKDFVRRVLKILLPLVIQNMTADIIGTPKLALTFEELWSENRHSDLLGFVVTFLIADLKVGEYMDTLRQFVRSVRNRNLMQLALAKLVFYYTTNHMGNRNRTALRGMIADIQSRLEHRPKSDVIQGMNRAELLQKLSSNEI